MTKSLKVTIKPKTQPTEGQVLSQKGYTVMIGDWELGRGVIDFKLEMPAGQKPIATVTFEPNLVDIDVAVDGIQTLFSKV